MKNLEEFNEELVDHIAEMIVRNEAEPGDFEVMLSELRPTMSKEEIDEAFLHLSPPQQRLWVDFIGSLRGGKIKQLIQSKPELENSNGSKAARLLNFVMSPDDVDEKVGDALERRRDFECRYGVTYSVWHYRWTIGCIFLRAVWRVTPVARFFEALLVKMNND